MESIEYFANTIAKDFFLMCAGEKLGRGASREVFEWKLDPNYVVKIELAKQSFSNAMEWDVWSRVQGTDIEKWFAPCLSISDCGTVLLQKKTSARLEGEYPRKIPRFFTDTKYRNFGFIGDQLVCHDYGINLLMEHGMNEKLKKAEWWK